MIQKSSNSEHIPYTNTVLANEAACVEDEYDKVYDLYNTDKPIFKTTNVFQRKFNRLIKKIKRVSLKKYLIIKYAKIFK